MGVVPAVNSSCHGLHFAIHVRLMTAGQQVSLASPIEVVGWPKPGWGERKYYRIRLLLFQDPNSKRKYCATLEGTPALFSELDEILEKKGGGAQLRDTIAVSCKAGLILYAVNMQSMQHSHLLLSCGFILLIPFPTCTFLLNTSSFAQCVLQTMFGFGLPDEWVDGLARAVMRQPIGFSMGGTVIVSKLASPELAPAITIVGDAAHAMTWRLGYSLETALDSAVGLVDSMYKASRLSEALESLNNDRLKEISALAKIDKVVCFHDVQLGMTTDTQPTSRLFHV